MFNQVYALARAQLLKDMVEESKRTKESEYEKRRLIRVDYLRKVAALQSQHWVTIGLPSNIRV